MIERDLTLLTKLLENYREHEIQPQNQNNTMKMVKGRT